MRFILDCVTEFYADAMNTQKHSTTKSSPYELVFGQRANCGQYLGSSSTDSPPLERDIFSSTIVDEGDIIWLEDYFYETLSAHLHLFRTPIRYSQQ